MDQYNASRSCAIRRAGRSASALPRTLQMCSARQESPTARALRPNSHRPGSPGANPPFSMGPFRRDPPNTLQPARLATRQAAAACQSAHSLSALGKVVRHSPIMQVSGPRV